MKYMWGIGSVRGLLLTKQVRHAAVYPNLANFYLVNTDVCMGSKLWTFGISWVLLAAYLYANTYTYLPIYVLLTSVSAYPPTQLPTTHHQPIY